MTDIRDKLAAMILRHGVFGDAIMPEDIPIEGNALVSGNDAEDKEAEDWVRNQLRFGNECAWCCYIVSAVFAGCKETTYLGCCSYPSFQALHDSEFENQKTEVSYALADRILSTHAQYSQIIAAAQNGLALERLLHAAR